MLFRSNDTATTEIHTVGNTLSLHDALPIPALGITCAPCAQTVINWGTRLVMARLESAGGLRGVPLAQAPFSHGLLWRIALRLGLGAGTM